MTCCLGIQAFLQLGVVMSDVTHQPNHLELGRLEQFKALSTYWDVFCGSGGLWTATVLDSGSPMSHTRHRYPIVPLLLLSIKGSPSRLFEKEKQTTSEVGARVPSLHPATFRMFRMCQRTGKVFRNLQCQMRFLHSCLHLTPETIPSNIPRGGQWAWATHVLCTVPALLGNMRFCTWRRLPCFDPLMASLQGGLSDSACVLSFILPLKDDISVYRRCLCQVQLVGLVCLLPFFFFVFLKRPGSLFALLLVTMTHWEHAF